MLKLFIVRNDRDIFFSANLGGTLDEVFESFPVRVGRQDERRAAGVSRGLAGWRTVGYWCRTTTNGDIWRLFRSFFHYKSLKHVMR